MGDNDFPQILAGKYMADELKNQPQREVRNLSRLRGSGARKAFYQMPEKDDAPRRRLSQMEEDTGLYDLEL